MIAPPAPTDPVAPPAISSVSGLPNINPATGLSTDYLNHFTEAIMALEMAHSMPECLDELRSWRPKTYIEHFEVSRFSGRDAVIRYHRKAHPALRSAIEEASATLNSRLAELRDMMIRENASADADRKAQRGLRTVRPLVARMAALINGATAERVTTQAMIDAMFGR